MFTSEGRSKKLHYEMIILAIMKKAILIIIPLFVLTALSSCSDSDRYEIVVLSEPDLSRSTRGKVVYKDVAYKIDKLKGTKTEVKTVSKSK